MEGETHRVDEQYLSGLWHNGETGEFEKYSMAETSNEVHIYNKEYELLDTVEYLETGHLIKVDEEAVNNPTQYFNETVDWLTVNGNIYDLPLNQEISFKYASENVKVIEQE